jgi:GAF domain-containing protein
LDVVTTYRLYLRGAGRILCRHEFAARDDGEAQRFAEQLAGAAADVCDAFEVWEGGRVVHGPAKPRVDLNPAPSEVSLAASAEAILQSDWAAAQSRRLASQFARWRNGRPDRSLLEQLIRQAVAVTGADTGNIQLHDGAGNLRIVAQHGLEREFLDYFAVVSDDADDTACGRALRRGQRIIVEDVAGSPIFRGKASGRMLLRAGLNSAHSTPITADGRLFGMISTHRKINWRPDAEELRRIDRIAADAASAIGA